MRQFVKPLLRVCGIYAVTHMASGMCYVGSSVDIGRRIRQHLSKSNIAPQSCFHRALAEHGADGFVVEVIERCGADALTERELFYIVMLNTASADGFNTIIHPAQSRLGAPVSEATRARLSESQRISERQRRHLAELHAANIGSKRPKSPEHRAKISASLTGKKIPLDVRKKMSASARGKKKSEAHRAAIGAAHIGRKHTPESRARMSLSAKARCARKKIIQFPIAA